MTHEFAILSPEKTILTFRLAGLGSRALAHLLDVLLIVAGIIGVASVAGLVFGAEPGLVQAISMITAALGPFAYFIFLEGLWNGQTLGKKATGLRVRLADGTPVTFQAALGRNLLRPADVLPLTYLVGLIAVFTNPKAQRIGDLVAGTIVVHEGRPEPRFSPAPHRMGLHPLEPHVGDLRGMTREEYVALKRLCDRFPELAPSVRDRLMRELWQPLARRRGVPPLATVHPIYLMEAVVMRYGREHGLL